MSYLASRDQDKYRWKVDCKMPKSCNWETCSCYPVQDFKRCTYVYDCTAPVHNPECVALYNEKLGEWQQEMPADDEL